MWTTETYLKCGFSCKVWQTLNNKSTKLIRLAPNVIKNCFATQFIKSEKDKSKGELAEPL
jgi:hypothetical protein